METLTLNDGSVLNGHILPGGDGITIFVYLMDMNIVQGVSIFSDADRISKIIESNHGTEHVYEGYTEIYAVSHEFGNCNIVMRKAGSNA